MTDELTKLAERCRNCAGEEWVCENHRDQPWEGSGHAANCGAGAPCPVCRSDMANAGLRAEADKWRNLTAALVGQFDFAGCTCTFDGPHCCSYADAETALKEYALKSRASQ